MVSLTKLVRSKFIDTVKTIYKTDDTWKVVVMDGFTRKIFDTVAQPDELFLENIATIEELTANRSANSSMACLYFIRPSVGNVEIVNQDLNVNKKYRGGHLLLTSEPDEETSSSLAVVAQKVRIQVLNVPYFPFESRVFSFNHKDSLSNLYSSTSNTSNKEIQLVAEKLMSVCLSLSEIPVVRYQALDSGLHNPKAIAEKLQGMLDSYLAANPNFGEGNSGKSRSILIVLDRSVDLAAPLLHELTYQALVEDVVGLNDHKTYQHTFVNGLGHEVEEGITLDERDAVWTNLRHMHIADLVPELVSQFKAAVGNNPTAQSQLNKGKVSLQGMRDVVSSLPELQNLSKTYSAHMELATRCLDKLKEPLAESLVEVQQNLVCQLTSEGIPIKPNQILSELAPLLTERQVSVEDKLRLLLLLATVGDPNTYDRRRLEAYAGINDLDKNAISNLTYLASNRPLVKPKETTKFSNPFRKSVKPVGSEEENPYALSRYVPQVKKIVMAQVTKTILVEEFPFVDANSAKLIRNPVTSLRVHRPSWQKRESQHPKQSTNSAGGRILVFVAGGLTFSEVRSVYEVVKVMKREVMVGTTHLLTPSRFMEDLRTLSTKSTHPVKDNRRSMNGLPRNPLPQPPQSHPTVDTSIRSEVPSNLPSQPSTPNSAGKSFGFNRFLNFK